MKGISKKKSESLINIVKIAVPDSMLAAIRQRAADKLRQVKVLPENASIIMQDLDHRQLSWIYQATQEKARIIVSKDFSILVFTGRDFKVDPPSSKYPDIIVIEQSPGNFNYVVFPKVIRDLIEGGGLNRLPPYPCELKWDAGKLRPTKANP